MEICTIKAEEYEGFVDFLDAGMRPQGTETRAVEDFPNILGRDNLQGMLGIRDNTGWIAGLASLTRPFVTSVGLVPVAGIGSVVTRDDHRGQGYSSRLQIAVLEKLTREHVPLAVLWTDQPEIYAGRGFSAAGWEYHLDLTQLPLEDLWPTDGRDVALGGKHSAEIAAIYAQHPWRTQRLETDHSPLYGMPGTRISGLSRDDRLAAYAACSKGEDFPDYVAEWGGDTESALAVLARAHQLGLASRALVPAGREDILEAAGRFGAGFALAPSGLWAVLMPELLGQLAGPVPDDLQRDPRAWLGLVQDDQTLLPGKLQIAVWGFDSV